MMVAFQCVDNHLSICLIGLNHNRPLPVFPYFHLTHLFR